MVRRSPGHKVGSMLAPVARNFNLPLECSPSAARLHLRCARASGFIGKSLRHLSVPLALMLGAVDLSARQGQCFEGPLESKLGLVIRLLGFILARCVQCALLFCRRPVPLSHRNLNTLDG